MLNHDRSFFLNFYQLLHHIAIFVMMKQLKEYTYRIEVIYLMMPFQITFRQLEYLTYSMIQIDYKNAAPIKYLTVFNFLNKNLLYYEIIYILDSPIGIRGFSSVVEQSTADR